ncbi:MAG: TetR/AcrR family transcriptional regulator, partial [Muribaculaceae bacterium]|nr:TetR/AcrR family transcriptional regulator [Muribaculaceae bacterium]
STREQLIDVARQLFARKGVEATTMGDIAVASERGRRTIYTYFRSKKDVYDAVLRSESDSLLQRLEAICTSDKPVEQRVREFLSVRLLQRREEHNVVAALRALYKPDIRRMGRIRRMVRERARQLLHLLLQQGIDSGVFDADRCRLLETFALDCMHAMEIAGADTDAAGLAVSADGMLDFIITDIRAN